MKRRLLPSLLLALALTACAAKPAVPTATDFEVQPGVYRYQDIDVFFIETEKGNHCMNPLRDYLIRFAEPGSHDFHILCNKPECKHEDTNCNAYAGFALGYFNQHLYGVQDNGTDFVLVRMNMDGTGHTEIARLPEQNALDGRKQLGGSYFFDNGYLIFLAFPCLYFPMFNGETGSVTYAEGNLETGRIEHVFEDWNQSNSPMVNFDNVLYYHRVGVGLCEYDKATGTETVKVPTDCSLALPQYTKDYIIVRTSDDDADTHRTIYAYDRNYHLLGQMELEPYGVKFPSLQYVTANAIYFTSGGKLVSYIDPHHLDRLELIQLVDPTARSHG